MQYRRQIKGCSHTRQGKIFSHISNYGRDIGTKFVPTRGH
jgi:hypothetical protein